MTVLKEGFEPSAIRELGAIVLEDYGSFLLVEFPPSVAVESVRAKGLRADPVQDPFLLGLNEHPFLSNSGGSPVSELPSDLTRSGYSHGETGLYIVQFYGPIKDSWLGAMKDSGVEIIEYLPSNSFVVRMTPEHAENLGLHLPVGLAGRSPLQWVGIYQPAYKVSRELIGREGPVAVSFMVLDDVEGNALLDRLVAQGNQIQEVSKLPPYLHLNAWVDGAQIRDLAFESTMYRMSEWIPPVLFDEPAAFNNAGFRVNGQVAGYGTAGVPYLTWLASKGFDVSSPWFGFVVNISDTGLDKGNKAGVWHQDLYDAPGTSSRVAYVKDWTPDAGGTNDGTDGFGHGTNCAGLVGGYNNAGGTGNAQVSSTGYHFGLGVAPMVRVGGSKIFDFSGNYALSASFSTLEKNAYAQGARISSNSWGYAAAGIYDAQAREYDGLVRDSSALAGNQEYLILFAAGNSGPPSTTVGSPGTAKNVITLAAAENWWPSYTACGWPPAMQNTPGDDIVYYSSRGPTADGRTKPDLAAIANGWNTLRGQFAGAGCGNPYDTASPSLYRNFNGTSAACPATAGAAALIYQDSLTHGGVAPTPAMVKAILAGTSRDLVGGVNCTNTSGTGPLLTNVPNNSQGWGLVNVGRAFDGTPSIRRDEMQVFGATGDVFNMVASVADLTKPVHVVLAWTDAPGNTTGNSWKNDLNLEVVNGANTYLGNVLTGGSSTTGGSADARNNLEHVILPAGTVGGLTIAVRAANIVADGVPGNADVTDQDFALYIYNAIDPNEPNNTLASATPIPCQYTSTGAEINPSGVDVDYYRLDNLTVGSWITVDIDARLSGSPLDSVLGVFDSSGNPIATSDDTPNCMENEPFTYDSFLHVQVPTSTIYIAVTSFADFDFNGGISDHFTAGPYTMIVQCNAVADPNECNDTLATAKPISCPYTSTQTAIDPAGSDVDYYRLDNLTVGSWITIDIDAAQLGSGLDSVLGVFDSSGNPVATSDDNPNCVESEPFTLDSYLHVQVPTSTIYIAVTSYADFEFDGGSNHFYTGPYTMTVHCNADPNECNNTLPTATTISCPYTSTQTEIDPAGSDVDYYRLDNLTVGSWITVDIDAALLGSGLDSVLGVFDSSGNSVATSDDAPNCVENEPFTLDSYLHVQVPTSTIYIAVTSYADFNFDGGADHFYSGPYTLIVHCNADPNECNNTCAAGTPISCPSYTSSQTEIYPAGLDVDWYVLSGFPGSTITIDIDAAQFGSTLDPLLGAFDSSCGLIALSDDNPAPGEPGTLDSYLQVTMPANGILRIGVTSYSDFNFDGGADHLYSGPYTLLVNCSLPPPGTVHSLFVSKVGSNLVWNWTPSCQPADNDYELYRGTSFLFNNHAPVTCTTSGATTWTTPVLPGFSYYLVVPQNATGREGSYGTNGSGGQIPQGNPACLPQNLGCP